MVDPKMAVQRSGSKRSVPLLKGLPQIKVGEAYLFFLTRPGSVGLSTTVGLGQGCFHVVGGEEGTAVNEFGNAGLFKDMTELATEAGPIAYRTLGKQDPPPPGRAITEGETMKTQRFLSSSFVTAYILAGSSLPVHAGGPLDICESSQPFLWPNQGQNIPFNPDSGTLGPLNNAQAIAAVAAAFQRWSDVPSATATYQNAGLLPVDVDDTNFVPFLIPLAPDGLSAIVFDATGEIFNLLFEAESGILGFAGPEWLDDATCEIAEGVSFLNGPEFTDAVVAEDVMVHEFGHYSNLAHTVVNGQVVIAVFFGVVDDMPSPDPAFPGFPPNPFVDIIETMYPFYLGSIVGTRTPEADDIAILSTLYPSPSFFNDFGSISGTILGPNATTKLTGVNVIARNVANPYADAVSAISSDFTDGLNQSDPGVGAYTINGLTPDANYVVFVDEVLLGGFSTPLNSPPPGPEEFYNGGSESNDPSSDDPTDAEVIMALAGSPVVDVDIVFNQRVPGEPLAVPDEGGVQLFLPFRMRICGEVFENIFINGNGYVSFGALGPNPSFFPNVGEFLSGPPKIAPLWADLDASSAGVVTFKTDAAHVYRHLRGRAGVLLRRSKQLQNHSLQRSSPARELVSRQIWRDDCPVRHRRVQLRWGGNLRIRDGDRSNRNAPLLWRQHYQGEEEDRRFRGVRQLRQRPREPAAFLYQDVGFP